MENAIIIGVLIVILGLAVLYVYKAKKKGCKCIGCPSAEACQKRNTCIRQETSSN